MFQNKKLCDMLFCVTDQKKYTKKLARRLILDELFDLTVYKKLSVFSSGSLKTIFDELIPIETRHYVFWQEFFEMKIEKLDFGRHVKLATLVLAVRIFGERAAHLILEALEVTGVRKYLGVWEFYRDDALGKAVHSVLDDEFRHEDQVVSDAISKKINPERIRNIFLGFNDGLVEILGAVSGFFAAFESISLVLAAGLTVAVAGALSMAAGAFAASSSEAEVRRTEEGKEKFLSSARDVLGGSSEARYPLESAMIVGVAYFFGAMVPILPVFLGAGNAFYPVLASGILIVIVSAVIAFLSGMNVRRRIAINLGIIAAAVLVTTAIGVLAKSALGIAI
ncbi:MAG: hypothetical protein A3G60_01465 [Candidatus Ryanbacteria bacterium RIFCSPLOWO2_12_FULL_47_9c]|uniref:Rubrerythrin family protein n=1 Tax=Candidatus Ryanbacteria bacterium RIFCSPLOWO2_12_FULL_47_9c TaxID=1802131 RepID=A0A1G2H488_9BACT|nr:MAG: hypothetical protein A3G60_01465 [Candidatus Ryanbacteria bacterium RIFCSPLOWO2_12_FULL_47_9c]